MVIIPKKIIYFEPNRETSLSSDLIKLFSLLVDTNFKKCHKGCPNKVCFMLYQHNSLVIHFCCFSQSGAGCRVRSCSRCWGNWSRNMENQRLVVWPLHAECGHQYGRPGVSAWSDCWGQSPQREACLADRKHGAGGVQRNRCSKAPWVTSIILYHYESILCGHGCILTLFLCISSFACLFFFILVIGLNAESN